jgi:MFS family permease
VISHSPSSGAVTRDGLILMAGRALRNLAYGALSVDIALYLGRMGLRSQEIGVLFTVALAAAALSAVGAAVAADRIGRRRTLALSGLLMAAAGALLASGAGRPAFFLAALLGSLSPTGQDVGPFQSLEQAALPSTTSARNRTSVFAWYNLGASVAAATGALIPGAFLVAGHLSPAKMDRAVLVGYAACGGALTVLAQLLTRNVEPAPRQDAPRRGGRARLSLRLHRSRQFVMRMAAVQGADALAGGLVVQSLIAYWFHLRFGADETLIGPIFFGTNMLAAGSFLIAARVAGRIGLLNTMVFTHLPSNVLLALVPAMPTLPLAAGMWLLRSALSQMDVPTRQAYMMAVVADDEREAAAGVTTASRTAAAAVAPSITGLALASAASGAPFVAAGVLKILYDLSLYTLFRRFPIDDPARKT